MNMEHRLNDIHRGKTCLSTTPSTKNLTRNDSGSKPDLRGERPASNRISHGTLSNCVRCIEKVQRFWPLRATKREQGTYPVASYNLATFRCNSQVFPCPTFQQSLKPTYHAEDGGNTFVLYVGLYYKNPQHRHFKGKYLQNSNATHITPTRNWDSDMKETNYMHQVRNLTWVQEATSSSSSSVTRVLDRPVFGLV